MDEHGIDHAAIPIKEILNAHEKRPKLGRRRKRGPIAAMTAYAFFRHDVLEEVCNMHPTATPEEIMVIVENKWVVLPDMDKQMYVQRAEADRRRYEDDVRMYLPKSQGGTMKRKKAKKHPNAPKHPMSAYLYFVADHRAKFKAENPEKGFIDIAKLLGERWRSLDEGTRQQYDSRALLDKERYKHEKDSFHPPPMEEKEEIKKRKKHPLAPRHPLSAYLYFVASSRPKMNKKYPDKDFTEIAQMLGATWKRLTPLQRRKYEIAAFVDKKRYEEEKEKWTPPFDKEEEKKKARLLPPKRPPTYTYWPMEQSLLDPAFDKASLLFDPTQTALQFGHPQIAHPSEMAIPPPPPPPHRRGRPRKYLAANEVLTWNAQEVGRFIASLGLAEHKDKFIRSGITGDHFVKLSSPELRDTFGISNIGDRKKIIQGISNLVR